MMVQTPTNECCPFVEEGNPVCSTRFTLGHLEQACDVCFGGYRVCPVYRRLVRVNVSAAPPKLTLHGYSTELRPTGS